MEQTGKADGVQPILNDLYAIRAGMSVISQKKEDIDQKTAEVNRTLTSATEQICGFYAQIDQTIQTATLKNNLELCQLVQIDTLKKLESKYLPQSGTPVSYSFGTQEDFRCLEEAKMRCKAVYAQKKHASSVFKGFSTVTLILTFAFIIALIAIYAAGTPWGESTTIGLFVGCLLGAIIFGIVSFILIRLKNNPQLKALQTLIDCCDGAAASTQTYTATRAKLHKELSEYSTPRYKISKTMYDTLVAQVPYLDPRDWKYVDTLIFYFETGRADTMKEALQHLDHEIQTRQIINTVVRATEYLAETIRIGIQQITERLAHIQALQTAQLQQQMMQTALLNKIAASSEQLASDVNYMNSQIASINAKL